MGDEKDRIWNLWARMLLELNYSRNRVFPRRVLFWKGFVSHVSSELARLIFFDVRSPVGGALPNSILWFPVSIDYLQVSI